MKKKILIGILTVLFMINGGLTMAVEKQTAGRTQLGNIAPKFAELNDDILFGEVWSREDKLSLRDRSIVTVTVLMTKGIFGNPLKAHMQNAKKNGITKEEMAEIITHAAFYAGWPNAWETFSVMKEVYKDNDSSNISDFDKENIFGKGELNTAYAKYFIGNSYLNPLSNKDDYLPLFNVTFEPKCRNNWHIHHATKGGGQVLIVTAGEGWYQEWGKEPVKLTKGMVVEIPANLKHWHGASKNSWFSHIAIEVPGENTSNEWLEPVGDEEYNKLK